MNVYSLKFNIWFYFTICILVALLVVICLQFFALRLYFTQMKERELQNAAKKFVEICKKSDFETTLNKSQFQSDLNLALFDVLGGSLWETSDFYKNDYLSNYQQQIIKSDYAITGVVAQDGRTMAYYGYRFDQHLLHEQIRPVYVYLTLDINVNSTTVTVLVKQWLILSTAVFLFATTFAWLLAYKLTEPIRRITSNAKQLAKGEYDVHFESSGYTEIDKLSSNLTLAAKQLGETEFLKNELIANVSHDLKTPLTLIKSYAEMVRDLSGDDKNKRTEHLNVIIGESDRLALLVDDLMQLSKLEAHRNEINPSDFCLSAAVEKTVRSFLTLTDYHFVADIEKDLYAFADEQKIIQVITNLMSNAVNYTGDDKYVGVKVVSVGERIRVDIIDHGVGIAEDEIGLIWDRYYRSNKLHKRETSGSGLGLSIVKGILTAHDAEYGVKSELEKGSDFYFIINKSSK